MGFCRLIAYCLIIAFFSPAGAQVAPAPAGGTVVAKMIGDHVLIRVQLKTRLFEKETHLLVDYGAREPLALHRNVIMSLRYGDGETALKVLSEGFRLEIPGDVVTQDSEQLIDRLTARYSRELENVDIAGVVGFPTLEPFSLGLDLVDGTMTLTPSSGDQAQKAEQTAGRFIRGVRIVDGVTYVPVTYDGGRAAAMAFGLRGYHTHINRRSAARLGKPSGDVDGIAFGAAEGPHQPLSGMAALRPGDFGDPKPDVGEELLRSGLSLWSAFRLEIDPTQGYLALTQLKDSNYSEADFVFYAAVAARDADALWDYVETYPEDRNVEEAAGLIFELGLEAGASVEDQMAAVGVGLSVTAEKRQAEYVTGFIAPLFNSEDRDGHSLLIVALGEQAMEFIGRSETPGQRQQIQLILGDRHLYLGDAHEAWKYFLSAAFSGDPRIEAVTRHELGRAYEALGRYRRAYSNYQRAIPDHVQGPPQLKERAKAALERLRPHLDPDDPLLKED